MEGLYKEDYSAFVDELFKDSGVLLEEITASDLDLIHAVMGISGEAGELLDAIKKATVYRKELDRENVVEELGDLEFYMEKLRQALNISRDQTLEHNFKKLNKRYAKGKYTDKAAQDRADKA